MPGNIKRKMSLPKNKKANKVKTKKKLVFININGIINLSNLYQKRLIGLICNNKNKK